MRRVIVPHRLAILASVRAALPSARSAERKGRREPVWTLQATILRDIVEEFVGEGNTLELENPRENEKKEMRKGGVSRRDGEMCTAFWHDTKASLRVRRRGCYIGAERRERGAGGRNLQRKKSNVIAE